MKRYTQTIPQNQKQFHYKETEHTLRTLILINSEVKYTDGEFQSFKKNQNRCWLVPRLNKSLFLIILFKQLSRDFNRETNRRQRKRRRKLRRKEKVMTA